MFLQEHNMILHFRALLYDCLENPCPHWQKKDFKADLTIQFQLKFPSHVIKVFTTRHDF